MTVNIDAIIDVMIAIGILTMIAYVISKIYLSLTFFSGWDHRCAICMKYEVFPDVDTPICQKCITKFEKAEASK